MQIYLVGGAIRDRLLHRSVQERDWVVVGATPSQMLTLGYLPVGKDFPVFLHPQTREEYALARTERKTAPGYKGFVFHADPEVTLEEDLQRRDLTINAIAEDEQSNLIDPFHGQHDLDNKLFRHVSPAFAEDPVRILRVARFAATYPDFSIHPDTQILMSEMVTKGEVDALVPERVWQECQKALGQTAPHRFFEVLEQCGALEVLFPALRANQAGLAALGHAVAQTSNIAIRLAVFLHALDISIVKELMGKYRIPNDYRDLVLLVVKHHAVYLNIQQLDAENLLTLLESLDAFRRPERLYDFLMACQIIYQTDDNICRYIEKLLMGMTLVKAEIFVQQGLQGKEIGEAVRRARLDVIGE